MITQRAVSVRLKKEGIQHMTDFEDMSNAFACTSANCRAEVLEELTTRRIDRCFLKGSSTPQYVTIPTRGFSTSQCGNLMGSSEGPIFVLAAYALPIIRWNMRTMAWEEEHLPLLQGQTPSGLECDLGLSTFADDVSKKVVAEARRTFLRLSSMLTGFWTRSWREAAGSETQTRGRSCRQ